MRGEWGVRTDCRFGMSHPYQAMAFWENYKDELAMRLRHQIISLQYNLGPHDPYPEEIAYPKWT